MSAGPAEPRDSDDEDRMDMRQLALGGDEALNRLMDRHGTKLFHYLIRQTGSETDAADLAQEAFVRVYQARERFDPKARFSTWLYTIASNLTRNRHRWKKRHPEISVETPGDSTGPTLGDTLVSANPQPAEELQRNENQQAVRNAVLALPEKLRTPLILAEYENRSMREIAAILFCSVKAVESRLARAREELKSKLSGLVE